MDELKTKSPCLEKDFGKTRDGQKMDQDGVVRDGLFIGHVWFA